MVERAMNFSLGSFRRHKILPPRGSALRSSARLSKERGVHEPAYHETYAELRAESTENTEFTDFADAATVSPEVKEFNPDAAPQVPKEGIVGRTSSSHRCSDLQTVRQSRQFQSARSATTSNAGDDAQLEGERIAAARAMGITLEAYNLKVSIAKMIGGFVLMSKGSVGLEKGSVYGTAILLPQLARTAGWPRFLTCLTFQSYVFLIVNLVAQLSLLYLIAKEEYVMDLFRGQMFLCDFGVHVSECPGGPGCMGPGGTEISPSRIYNFNVWKTRMFVRDSLISLFPDREKEIHEKVDPGEYAMESSGCRLLCCMIFMMSVMNELFLNIRMLKLIWYTPSKAEDWIDLAEDVEPESGWVDDVKISVKGMPIYWKVINLIVVFLPKMLLWKITAETGVVFLMETSSIEDIIVNSVALTFVLNIDEMFFELMGESARMMLESCEEMPLYDPTADEDVAEDEMLEKYCIRQDLKAWRFADFLDLVPWNLSIVLMLLAYFISNYYFTHCDWGEGGRFVSKSMFTPAGVSLPVLSAFFPRLFPRPTQGDAPFWTMPGTEQE